jgi:cytochrome b561
MATATAIDPATRYNATARLLHAVIAVLAIGNVLGGLLHEPLEDTINIIPLHKSFGLLILALTLVRIGWRLTWTRPDYSPPLKPFDLKLAKAVHFVFYVLLLAIPVSGYVFSSAGKYPITFFGLPVPKLAVEKSDPLVGLAHEGHEIMGFLMLGLIVLHVAAALRHHYMLKDGVLRRMW